MESELRCTGQVYAEGKGPARADIEKRVVHWCFDGTGVVQQKLVSARSVAADSCYFTSLGAGTMRRTGGGGWCKKPSGVVSCCGNLGVSAVSMSREGFR